METFLISLFNALVSLKKINIKLSSSCLRKIEIFKLSHKAHYYLWRFGLKEANRNF
jgi:hypothetical protein